MKDAISVFVDMEGHTPIRFEIPRDADHVWVLEQNQERKVTYKGSHTEGRVTCTVELL